MVRIRISDRQLVLFKMSINDDEILKFLKVENNVITIIDNQLQILEKIISAIMSKFLEKGLKKNDEPNLLGLELENLNDRFIIELQRINDTLDI